MEKNPKVTASCRIPLNLKEAVEREANEKDMTFSNYVESIIRNRTALDEDHSDENHSDDECSLTELEAENIELSIENERLMSENQDIDLYEERIEELKNENLRLLTGLKEVQKTDTFTSMPVLSKAENDSLEEMLRKLQSIHRDVSPSLLLLGALDTTLRTEKAFWTVPTINKFLNNQNRLR